MSAWTEIIMGSARRLHDPAETIRRLLSLIEAEDGLMVSRTLGESRDLARFEEYLLGEHDEPHVPEKILDTEMAVGDVPKHYREGTCLIVDAGATRVSRSIKAEMRANLEEDLLMNYSINSLFLKIGDHDVVQLHDEMPILIGRYFVSLIIGANGAPDGPEDLLREVQGLAEFRDLRSRFASEFGAADLSINCVY